MLGKLLKHEFRATGRTMLPTLGVLAALVLLANVSVRLLDANVGTFLSILSGLMIGLTVVAVIAAEIMPVVMMVQRFYRNLLSNEGYLMHTLPVGVHGMIWSKLIVSSVWMLATNLVIFLLGGFSVLHLTRTNLAEFLRGIPSLAEINALLAHVGISTGDVVLVLLEIALAVVLVQLAVCLHFYAAMSLGHMFSRRKGLWSVIFFVALSYLMSALTTFLGHVQIPYLENLDLDTVRQSVHFAQAILGEGLGVTVLEGAVFYIATVLGLKKGLNLA